MKLSDYIPRCCYLIAQMFKKLPEVFTNRRRFFYPGMGTRIRVGTSIGYDSEADKRRGCTSSDNGIVVVPNWTVI
ncbi:hypothetical protein ACFLTS_06395 [Chloroflexota bacterium]